jgi:hypothetical protein
MDNLQTKVERLAQDALAKSSTQKQARAARAAENRRLFPTAAEAMDKFACFSPRVLYASEGGRELGKRPSWHGEVFTNRNPSATVAKVRINVGKG